MEGANVQSSSLEATQRPAPAPAEGGDWDRASIRGVCGVVLLWGLLPVSCTGRTAQPSRLPPGRQPQPVDAVRCVTDPLEHYPTACSCRSHSTPQTRTIDVEVTLVADEQPDRDGETSQV
jgi:hypothetical protein